MAKKVKRIGVNDLRAKICGDKNSLETVSDLKRWCHIDATYGKVPLPDQLKSAAKALKNKREYAATVILGVAAELR